MPNQTVRRKADLLQEDAYRRMTPAQRVRVAIELSELLFSLKKASLRERHPGCSEAELMREFAREVHGIDRK